MSETPTPRPIARLADVRAERDVLFTAFAVLRDVREGRTKGGDPFLDLELGDCSRMLRAKVWSESRAALDVARELQPRAIVKVLFQVETFQDRMQLNVRNLRTASADEDGCETDLLFGPGYELVADLCCDTLVFDIETVPAADRRSLPPTIAESLARHAERMDSDEAKVMGLSPFFGKVVSIAVGDGERPPDEQAVTVLVVPPAGAGGDLPDWIRPCSERELLEAWWTLAAGARTVVSFNGRGFDVPFLVARSLVHGVGARVDLLGNRWAVRPHLDLYRAMAGGERVPGPANLDVLCWALGIESPKGQMDGSMVAPAYERGEIEKIAVYNSHDVRATTAVYQQVRDSVLSFRDDW